MLNNTKKLTCVIVKYKTPELLSRLVSKLRGGEVDLVVSDNHNESTPSELKVNSDHYKYIDNGSNIGFGAAANRGAKGSQAEWLLFLNTDVDTSAGALKNLVEQAEKLGLDASCPITTDPRYNVPLPSFSWFLGTFTPLNRFPYLSRLANKKPLTLWGGCLLIKRQVLEKLNGFDERFFLWFEDSDLTYRLISAGYKVGRVGVEGLVHAGGVSFESMSEKQKRKLFFTSAYAYMSIHGTWYDRLLVTLLRLRYSAF